VDAAFARIYCVPLALVSGAGHVMVLGSIAEQIPPRPVVDPPTVGSKRGSVR